jgi:hypothetical protein
MLPMASKNAAENATVIIVCSMVCIPLMLGVIRVLEGEIYHRATNGLVNADKYLALGDYVSRVCENFRHDVIRCGNNFFFRHVPVLFVVGLSAIH